MEEAIPNYAQFSFMERDKRIAYLRALRQVYQEIVNGAFDIFQEITENTFRTSIGDIVQVRGDIGSIARQNTITEVNSRLVDLISEASRYEKDPQVLELAKALHKEIADYEHSLKEGLN